MSQPAPTAPKGGVIPFGSSGSIISVEHFNALRTAWEKRRLVLFLGAGVSIPYGLSNWNDLVLDMMDEAEKLEQFWPNYRRALAAWLIARFNFSLTALARVLKRGVTEDSRKRTEAERQREFMLKVRGALYRTYREPAPKPTAISAIVEMLKKSQRAKGGRHIPTVLTTNFDNILELKLGAAGVDFEPVFDARRPDPARLSVVHVHGYLPKEPEPIPETDLILGEDDYHRLSYSAFNWSLGEIISTLRKYTVLFVGMSMSDPNLRRLLDASYVQGSSVAHYLLRENYDIPPHERADAMNAVTAGALEYARKFNLEEFVKTPPDIDRAITVALRQAREFDSQLFRDMGVGVVWVRNYDDIPTLLTQISA